MPETDAVILKNWFPEASRARVRMGHASHATGLGDSVETLMTYASGSTQEMWAAADGDITEVSSSGAVGSPDVTGMTNNRWQHSNFGTSAGRYLLAVNGADTCRLYNGSSWSTTTWTGSGLTATDLIHINAFKNRLFFCESGSLSFWYASTSSISGTLTEFDLSSYCSLGGYLMAMGNWTRDGGDGLDDIAVFYTSRGEVLLFQGTDPGSASAWSLIGRYVVGAPVGRRCMLKVGPDLVLISDDGFMPMKALQSGRVNRALAVSDKIRDAVNTAVNSYGSNWGWEAVLYPRGQWVLFNIPLKENVKSEQYVANSVTGAWCRFTGMNANCWTVFNDELYFGGDAEVFKADTGFDDDGADIETDINTAFSYFGMPGRNKQFNMVRPVLSVDGDLNVIVGTNVDFEDTAPTGTASYTAAGAEWDVAEWDVAEWSSGPTIAKDWLGVNKLGFAASLRMRTSSQIEVLMNSVDWLYEPGAYV